MTHETDVQRQWDGIESTPVGRVAMKVASVSDIRVANLIPKDNSAIRGFVFALPIAGLIWLGMYAAWKVCR